MGRMLVSLSVGIVVLAGCGSSRTVTSSARAHSRPESAKASPLATPVERVIAHRGKNGVYRSIKPGTLVAGKLVGARAFAEASHGFGLYLSPAGEGFPAATTDGGRTWRIDGPVFFAPAADGAAGVSYTGIASPRTYFAYGSSAVDVTTDSGRQWWEAYLGESVVAVVARPAELIAVVQQTPSGNGSLVANTWVYVSIDGGRVWRYDDLLNAYVKVPQRNATTRALHRNLRACTSAQLHVDTPTAVDGLIGTEVVPVIIVNTSSDRCGLAGYPRVQLLDGHGHVEAVTTKHGELSPKEPTRVMQVALAAHGGRATFGLSFTDHPGPAPVNDCRPLHTIRVGLPIPHATRTTTTGIPAHVCLGRPAPWLYVSPIGS